MAADVEVVPESALTSKSPIVSIVVPTRNRHFYLACLIRTLLGMKSDDFEIVVHDNSDENGEYLRECGSITDPRLRYYFNPAKLSIAENCDQVLSLARGRYVCMIGDDDVVTESIVDLARWMEASGIEAAATVYPAYLWPGVGSRLDGQQSGGILRLPRYTGRIERVKTSAALHAVLASGGIMLGDLPSVYAGVISKRALDDLKAATGTYFPGPSPDMANAIGVSAFIESFVKVSVPIYVAGACPKSASAEGARHGHVGEVADKTFLGADTAARWPAEVPFFFSGQTLLAATLIHALEATGRGSLRAQIRLDRLYAACGVFHRQYADRVASTREKNGVSAFRCFAAAGWVWWQRAKALARNLVQKSVGRRRIVGLQDTAAVVAFLSDRFRSRPFGAAVR
jgi:hypothetical protein